MKQLKSSNDEKDKEKLQKEQYRAALDKAQGVKRKDDPALLKKTIKRQEAAKKKSGRDWTARKSLEKQGMAKRQETRQKNIQVCFESLFLQPLRHVLIQ